MGLEDLKTKIEFLHLVWGWGTLVSTPRETENTLTKTSLKGQALAYFIAEFTYEDKVREILHPQLFPPRDPSASQPQELPYLLPEVSIWIVDTDGASNKQGSGSNVLLITPEGDTLETLL